MAVAADIGSLGGWGTVSETALLLKQVLEQILSAQY
ncbi:hypothetical protein MWMV18_MWMV18_02544 [Acinetobacter calcoaceticus]|nr:hypothetical protein MWMV18_MWMV18_02544 [Acinetobacter calcoaceticus]